MWNFVIVLLVAVTPIAIPTTPESLIAQLGNVRFNQREKAAKLLEQMDLEAIPHLKKHLDDEDVEIRYTCRYLMSKLLNVRPDNNEIPKIWSLPNSVRYKVEDMDGIGFNLDAAKYYYEQAWILNGYGDKPEVNYSYSQVAQDATLNFVADCRLDGASMTIIQELYREMLSNEKSMFHTYFDYWDDNYTPSPLLTRKVHASDNGFYQ